MKFPRLSFEQALAEVVLSERCMGCSACVTVCPVNCLEYTEGKPRVVGTCNECGICAAVCPRYEFSWPILEEFTFGRKKRLDEDFGIYRRIAIAQSTDATIQQICQDGGVVTALLMFALKEEIIDGAALSGVSQEKPLYPVPTLATTPEDIMQCSGTRYFYSPNLMAFQEGVKHGLKKLAFVGTPCQIHSLRKINMVPLKKFSNPLAIAIGLMCTECFTYKGLMSHLQTRMGLNLTDISKMNIKAKLLVHTKAGETKVIPLKEAKKFIRLGCRICTDFSAELADISAGGLGLTGWTFTILRTEKGEELFQKAESAGILRTMPTNRADRAFELLAKLTKRKRTVN